MKINKLWILCLLILCSCSTKNEEDIVSRGFERAELQLSAQLKVLPALSPRYSNIINCYHIFINSRIFRILRY